LTVPPADRVVITHRVKQDLCAIVRCIAEPGSPGAAEHVLDKALKTGEKPAPQPVRGACPAELLDLGILRYRQVCPKP